MNQVIHSAIIRTLRMVQDRFRFLLIHGTDITEIPEIPVSAELPVDGPYVGLFLKIDLNNGRNCYHCVISVSHNDIASFSDPTPEIEAEAADNFIRVLSNMDIIICCDAAFAN